MIIVYKLNNHSLYDLLFFIKTKEINTALVSINIRPDKAY